MRSPRLLPQRRGRLINGSRKRRMPTSSRRRVADGGGGGGAGGASPSSSRSSKQLRLHQLLRLLLLIAATATHATVYAQNERGRGDKKFGDKCLQSIECGFDGSVCDTITKSCICNATVPITNHLDKCGLPAGINQSCFFNEQCESVYHRTECKEGICVCKFQEQAIFKPDGSVECVVIQTSYTPERYVDPTMIGILVAMFLMFITICVVLRLFSKARWRENRTIFNTPNPRLMNASLLKDKHHDRRGSKTSRAPSRQPSMSSLRPHSPNSQGRLFLGSRRGSRASSNVSLPSTTRSAKSPPQNINSATTPMLESVTVEIQEVKETKADVKA